MSRSIQEAPEHLRTQFSVRRDHNGLRVVYNLGNELGDCPFRCTFCSVGQSPQVTTAWNLEEFERQHEGYLEVIDGIYHPLVYNQGNVTNPPEFSRSTLFHILQVFAQDSRVAFVSLNSRACHATRRFLDKILEMELPYPVHFIFGVESTSPRAAAVFGKDTTGELEDFFEKLAPYNDSGKFRQPPRGYNFGLDLNLVFLPELYLEDGEPRAGNESRIVEGMSQELQRLLAALHPAVPAEINLHPYHRVETLEYDDLDLEMFIEQLPSFQEALEEHNESFPGRPGHLFVGVEGSGFDSIAQRESVAEWEARIDRFNRGDCFPEMSAPRSSITIDTDRHLLLVIDPSGRRVRSYTVATARYTNSPKFWATDYRNPRGTYHIRSVYPPGSEELQEANSFYVPWYLSSKVRDPHEDAGRGLFGAAMIMLDYPNAEDYTRYLAARRSGCLRKRWEEFCCSHLRPIYEDVAEQGGVPFEEVQIDGDYGCKGFQELLEEFPVADPASAFRLGAGIHGTNDPDCIGTSKTAGCFRMHDEDILELLDLVDLGTRVEIDPPGFFSI